MAARMERAGVPTVQLMLHLLLLLIVLLLCSTVRLLHSSLRCPSWHEFVVLSITLVLFGRKDCLKLQNEGTQTMASTSECFLFAFI